MATVTTDYSRPVAKAYCTTFTPGVVKGEKVSHRKTSVDTVGSGAGGIGSLWNKMTHPTELFWWELAALPGESIDTGRVTVRLDVHVGPMISGLAHRGT